MNILILSYSIVHMRYIEKLLTSEVITLSHEYLNKQLYHDLNNIHYVAQLREFTSEVPLS